MDNTDNKVSLDIDTFMKSIPFASLSYSKLFRKVYPDNLLINIFGDIYCMYLHVRIPGSRALGEMPDPGTIHPGPTHSLASISARCEPLFHKPNLSG